MKKLLAVFLMAALVLSLVACSGASTQQDAKTQTATTDNTNAAKAETQNTNAVKWPEGALTLNCGGKAGGSTDLVSRAFAEYLGKELGVPVVVTNGDAIPQIQATHDAQADGYTMLTSAMGSFLYGKVGSMTFGIEEMTPVAVISEDGTFGLWTYGGAAYQTVGELVEYMKAHPGEVNIGMKTGTDYGTLKNVKNKERSRYCFCGCYKVGGKEYITVVLGAPNRNASFTNTDKLNRNISQMTNR